ncbi:flagellar biosynthesis protein FliP [Photobacterium aphoticum]|uniref:Flagellar biosynthesis protein FliP n=1 Tax=Photobacterium aphoticum TaxID=754436 RepID=A0A090RIG1_9GAMM|nr:flagellar biosynthesis protein FliP [Photobacterium aphoticum]
MSNWLRIALCGGLLLSHPALAQDIPLLSINGPSGQEEYSVKMQVFLLMTALSLLPAMLLMVTSFTRIIIVLGILRQALGLQQSPPNKVLIGIAMTLTLFIMRPVLTTIHDEAYVPYQAGTLTLQQAMETASPPLKTLCYSKPAKPIWSKSCVSPMSPRRSITSNWTFCCSRPRLC